MSDSDKVAKRKFTKEALEFLDAQLKEKPAISYSSLINAIAHEFGVNISKATISKRLRTLGLKRLRGRRKIAPKGTGKRPSHSRLLDCAGAFFLKGAELEIGLLDAINSLFKVETDNPQAQKVLRLAQRINALLLYSSVFGLYSGQEIACYSRRGLYYLAEEEVLPGREEIAQYLHYLKENKLLVPIAKEVTSNCPDALFVAIEHKSKNFYIDTQARTVWPSTKIPPFFAASLSKAKSYVNNAFINPSPKNPLILQTAPGYTFLPNEAFNLINCFESAQKGPISKVEILDREGKSLESWLNLKPQQKGYFIFPLSPWQYERLQQPKIFRNFEQFQIGPKRENMAIADAYVDFYDSQLKANIRLRTALIKRANENIALVTNISRSEERYIRKIAQMYFSSWPDKNIKTFYDLMEEGHEQASKRSKNPLNLKTLFAGSGEKGPQEVFALFVELLHRYAKNRFFPTQMEEEPLKTMLQNLYTRPGYLKIKKNSWQVILQPFTDADPLKDICQEACQKFNQCSLKLHNDKWLHIYLQNNK
ncbi:MAG: helix-turn-helix domain-containing protein [Candidatus Omnitrophica bacterium]|nr:helix-turn-helix domain-containing protein [Candidatus Omnitrophota bacterium]